MYEPNISFYDHLSSLKNLPKYFLQICKNSKLQISAFCLITFDSFEVHECAIPKNEHLNQTNLAYLIAFPSKMTGSMLKIGFYESQILGIPL